MRAEVLRFADHASKPKERFSCFDCLGLNDVYSIRDEVWREAWPTHRQDRAALQQVAKERGYEHKLGVYLCFGCLETRLGRKLTIKDFKSVPINNSLMKGFQMGLDQQLKKREK